MRVGSRRVRATVVAATAIGIMGVTAASASAATYYVDQASKGGKCLDSRTAAVASTVSTPWCTLTRALAQVPAGGVVAVRAGTYPQLNVTGFTRASTVTVSPYAAEKPLVQGMLLTSVDHLTFSGLRFGNVRVLKTSSDLAFTGDDFTPSGLWAEYVTRLNVTGNTFHDIATDGLVMKFDTDVTVRGNTFRTLPVGRTTSGGDGIQARRLTRAVIAGNSFSNIYSKLGHADSVELLGTNQDVLFDANQFTAARGPIIVRGDTEPNGQSRGVVIQNNLFFDMKEWALSLGSAPGVAVRNNTAWNTGTQGVRIFGSTKGAIVQNNILSRLDALAGSLATESNNLVTASNTASLKDPAFDPRFVNPTAADYRLTLGSPAIDAGTSTGTPLTDRLGQARFDVLSVPNRGAGTKPFYDIGAFEYRG
jgi:hypothetical protein